MPHHLAAVYEPGRRMALFINGHPSGELTLGAPEAIFDSDTPVYLGNRFGGEKSCGLDGRMAGAWFYEKALDARTVAKLAVDQDLSAEPKPEFPPLEPPYDLGAIKARVQAWYGRLQAPRAGSMGPIALRRTQAGRSLRLGRYCSGFAG